MMLQDHFSGSVRTRINILANLHTVTSMRKLQALSMRAESSDMLFLWPLVPSWTSQT